MMIKGVYFLLIRVNQPLRIRVGNLGELDFQKSYYVYVGSAQNNLKKRLERHFSKKKKIRWHADYLLDNKNVKIESAFYKESSKEEECNAAEKLSQHYRSIPSFGSSDCKCSSHLFKVTKNNFLRKCKHYGFHLVTL